MVKSTRILVVDDDADMRDSVVAMLAASGMETASTTSGRAAYVAMVPFAAAVRRGPVRRHDARD